MVDRTLKFNYYYVFSNVLNHASFSASYGCFSVTILSNTSFLVC